MLNPKDWFIEYVAHTDTQPTEEEWGRFIDATVDRAEYTHKEE